MNNKVIEEFRGMMQRRIDAYLERISGEAQRYPEDYEDATPFDLEEWFYEEC